MKVKGHFKSEAEAYQWIRWHWKKMRDFEQRKISMWQWEVEHEDKHPQAKKMVMEMIGENVPVEDFHMPIERAEPLLHKIRLSKLNVSHYQNLLNGYKVVDNG